ncbi:MAG: arylesterase [Vicinamibacterales bacterium]
MFARRLVCVVLLGVLVPSLACRKPSASLPDDSSPPSASAPSPPTSAPSSSARPRIVFLGDSLTAGLGLPTEQGYPSLIQRRLDEEGYQLEVVNAGVSGDTSAGGLRRLEWSLEGDVRVLIVALGGNDALRGLPPAELRKNLAAILDRAAARGVTVILAGMEAPPNNGQHYTEQFRAVYAELATSHKVRLIPFLLDGVAGQATLNQADGIHPNARGARIIADLVWQHLQPVLKRSATSQ